MRLTRHRLKEFIQEALSDRGERLATDLETRAAKHTTKRPSRFDTADAPEKDAGPKTTVIRSKIDIHCARRDPEQPVIYPCYNEEVEDWIIKNDLVDKLTKAQRKYATTDQAYAHTVYAFLKKKPKSKWKSTKQSWSSFKGGQIEFDYVPFYRQDYRDPRSGHAHNLKPRPLYKEWLDEHDLLDTYKHAPGASLWDRYNATVFDYFGVPWPSWFKEPQQPAPETDDEGYVIEHQRLKKMIKEEIGALLGEKKKYN